VEKKVRKIENLYFWKRHKGHQALDELNERFGGGDEKLERS